VIKYRSPVITLGVSTSAKFDTASTRSFRLKRAFWKCACWR